MDFLKEVVCPIVIVCLVIGAGLFALEYYSVKADVDFSIKCQQVGLIYQNVGGNWICR